MLEEMMMMMMSAGRSHMAQDKYCLRPAIIFWLVVMMKKIRLQLDFFNISLFPVTSHITDSEIFQNWVKFYCDGGQSWEQWTCSQNK